jgi:hypothetical protein
VRLAREHFNYDSIKSEQERQAFDRLFHSVYSVTFNPEADILAEDKWGPERTLKAAWIEWLCKDQAAISMVQPSGISITGAKIDGEIHLAGTEVPFPLAFFHCYFTSGVNLQGTAVRGLHFEDTRLGQFYDLSTDKRVSLEASSLIVNGDANFERCNFFGSVLFSRAIINRKLRFLSDNFENQVFDLTEIDVASIDLDYIESQSGLILQNAKIKGDLVCFGSDFGAGDGFQGDGLSVGHDLLIFSTIAPNIAILSAAIGGSLGFEDDKYLSKSSKFKNIDLSFSKIDGDLLISAGILEGGLLTLSYVKLDRLAFQADGQSQSLLKRRQNRRAF